MGKTYEGIDAAKWEAIRGYVLAYGITIDKNTGSGEAMGVTLNWAYAPASKILNLFIADAGMFPEEMALEYVDAIIQGAIA